MAKIIAFPGNQCCTQRSKHAASSAVPLAGGAVTAGAARTSKAGQVHPIWRAGTRGIVMSVVLPARGRPGLLNRCLAALTRQTLPAHRYEIIIIDSAPSSASRKVVESYLNRPGNGPCLIYLPVDCHDCAAEARNHGWHIARGALIAFTEEDTIPCRDWLAQGLQAFDGVAQAVRGRILTPLPGMPTEYELTVKNLEQAEFASINCFCLKHVLDDLGGFDERFRDGGRDDADLYFRLLQADAGIADAPLAMVEHPVGQADWGTCLQQQKSMQFDALLYKKHPLQYRQKAMPAMLGIYHAITLTLLFVAISLALHKTPAALAGAACWLLLSASLCLRRMRGTVKSASSVGEILLTSLLLPPLAVFWRVIGALRFRVPFI